MDGGTMQVEAGGSPAGDGQAAGGRADGGRRPVLGWAAAAVVVGLVGSGALVWQSTNAVFSSTTNDTSNSWTAGAVTLSNDSSTAALFTPTGLTPGSTGSNCITVTYSGNVATAVKLYIPASSGALAPYIDLVISAGTGGSFGSCTGFSGSQIYSGTLSAFATASTAYASGVGTWAPSTSGSTQVYKIVYTLDSATPNNMQSGTCSATFQWESQA